MTKTDILLSKNNSNNKRNKQVMKQFMTKTEKWWRNSCSKQRHNKAKNEQNGDTMKESHEQIIDLMKQKQAMTKTEKQKT